MKIALNKAQVPKALIVALILGSTAISYGLNAPTASSSPATFYACLNLKLKTLNSIQTKSVPNCPTGQINVSWNSTGPKGDQGLPGNVGPRGIQGLTGPAGETFQSSVLRCGEVYFFPNIQFYNPSGRTVDCNGVNFSGKDLTRYGGFKGVTFQNSDLSGADLSGVDLSGIDFTGANLTGANLTNSILCGAILDNSNLTGATLSGVKSGSIQGNPSLPTQWKIVKGYLVGPGASIAFANFDNADLSGANLSKVDFSGQNPETGFTASFVGANLTGAILTDTNFEGVNLSLANFSGADLTNSNLRGSSVMLANFTGAILTGAITAGPNSWEAIDGTVTTDFIWTAETICPNGQRFDSGGDCPLVSGY